ncbi:hypothetical protein OHB39_21780 [Streptomyces sp. NBC_00047]|uniref:hypothetical protein n=1 Tax=Streptomyces sp. NBC_00047 TaxID=2975627 RepID=UPI0022561F4A|nr:hypothetical protein [Streptomyces sp. NBC_00047]MCX5610186.1 hypothetical protein [Streptomyces sp. NBC_00047]
MMEECLARLCTFSSEACSSSSTSSRLQNTGLRIVGFRNTFENGQALPEAQVRNVRDSVAPGIRRTEALPFGSGRHKKE